MVRKLSPRRDLFLICAVMSILTVLAGKTPWFVALENKTIDSRFRWRYGLKQRQGKITVSDQVVLVGVDQKSVDPSVSSHSDRWGSGGWLSRDHWIDALAPLANHYKPRVVAYDIIFQPYRTQSSGEGKQDETIQFVNEYLKPGKQPFNDLIQEQEFPRIKLLNLLDTACNSNFAARFFDMDSEREAGKQIPQFITAYQLTSSKMESATPWQANSKVDKEKIDNLMKEKLPLDTITHVPQDYPFWDNAALPFDDLAQSPVHLGYINVPRDTDGNLRRVPLVIGFNDPTQGNKPVFVSSLALKACLVYLGIDPTKTSLSPRSESGMTVNFGREIHLWTLKRDIRIPIDRYGNMFLNFEGKIHDFQEVPYVEIANCEQVLNEQATGGVVKATRRLAMGNEIKQILKDRIAMVGVTFTGAADVGPTAVDSNTPFVFIHMTVIDNIMRGSFLRPLREETALFLLGLVPFAVGVINLRPRILISALGTLALLVGYMALAFGLVYINTVILPLALPSLSMLATFTGISLYRYGFEQRGRLEVRKRFSAMTSPKALQYMEEHPEKLAGEKREATMFFSDVAGFTSFSERLPPDELGQILNRYLTPMADLILTRDGYVNKFNGDGIMAVWGVLYPHPDHAVQACFSALEQQAKIRELLTVFKEEYEVDLEVRMGLNTGIVSAGNMGSHNRYEYTVMGDPVNFAARLEPSNKDYGTKIMIGERTYELAKDHIEARLLDRIVVKGKTQPVGVYELVGRKGEISPLQRKGLEWFSKGLAAYWRRDWTGALEAFEKTLGILPGDPPTQVFMDRVKDFQKDPPPADWDGSYVRKRKD